MEKKIIVIASNNKHKIKEFKEIFSDYNILSMEDIGFYDDVEENGETFLENALLKASAVHEYLSNKGLQYTVIADDSGLCVEALGGRPGVYSARYAGEHSHEANRHKIIEEMKEQKNKTAYFVCVLVKMNPDGSYVSQEGRTYGEILEEERGDTSFGYDSIFYSVDLKKSFGEASSEEKNLVSHRGRAIELLRKNL